MKRLLHTIATLLFILAILLANPNTVLASEGDGEHALELEVNGYHVTVSSQGEWAKGENTIVVTLTDSLGRPLSDTEVEILITAKKEEHAESELDSHSAEQQHDSTSGMDMDEPASHTSNEPAHEVEERSPIQMMESEHGIYIAEVHLEASGQHEIQVMFHANGEMLQADFIIEVPGMSSRTIVMWSFVVVNVGLVASAGILKKGPVPMKGSR
jgi:hypothetical protein